MQSTTTVDLASANLVSVLLVLVVGMKVGIRTSLRLLCQNFGPGVADHRIPEPLLCSKLKLSL